MCAPTGTAAVNAGGETMHSIYHIPIPAYGASLSKLKKSDYKTLVSADTVIIDEVSMARADVFSFAIKVHRRAEKMKGSPIRLIVVGDFCQLPPVVPKTEVKRLVKYGFHPSGFPFTTSEWHTLNFKTIELSEIYRQTDKEFIDNLELVKKMDESCLSYFNSFVTDKFPDDAIRVCGTNAEADDINADYLDSLPGLPVAYMAKKTGRTMNLDILPIILLKEDARVMFTVNDDYHKRFYNGSFGRVVTCDRDFVDVELESGDIVRVTPHTYKAYSFKSANGKLTKNEIGTVKQIPLKIARAVTIHKSQGKTFDKMVLTPNIFAPGQLYVALSRVKSADGLYLTEAITPDALRTDPLVLDFLLQGYVFKGEIPKRIITKKPIRKTKTPGKEKQGSSTRPTPRKRKTRGSSQTSSIKKNKRATVSPHKKTIRKKVTVARSTLRKPVSKSKRTVSDKKPAAIKTSSKKRISTSKVKSSTRAISKVKSKTKPKTESTVKKLSTVSKTSVRKSTSTRRKSSDSKK